MGTDSQLELVLGSDCWEVDPAILALLGGCSLDPGAISPFSFPSNSTVVSGAAVSTKGLLPPVWSFGEVFQGWCADKLAVS